MAGEVRFGNNTDYQFNQALNMLAQSRSLSVSGLGTGQAGLLAYSTGRLYVLNEGGTAFELIATDSDLLDGNNAAYYLNRANQSGQIPASDVSGLETAILSYSLDQFTVAADNVNLNGHRITGLADATAGNEAAAWGQVLALINNRTFKDPARIATTENITLSGLAAIDGITPVAGDRILVKDQTDGSDNGTYIAAAGSWTRSNDEIVSGIVVSIEEGDANGDKLYMLVTNNPITVDTTSLVWAAYGASSGEIGVAGDGLTKTGSTYDVGAGFGVNVNANDVAIDTSVIARVVRGTVPSGGSPSVNIVHSLGLSSNQHIAGLALIERATGDVVEFGWTTVDSNTVSVVLPAAPAANEWDWTVTG